MVYEFLGSHTWNAVDPFDLYVFECIVIEHSRQSLCKVCYFFFLFFIGSEMWAFVIAGWPWPRSFVTYYWRIIRACTDTSILCHIQTWSLTGPWPILDCRVRVICDWMIMNNNRMDVIRHIRCIDSSVYMPVSWWCWPSNMTNAIFHWRLALIRRRVPWRRRVRFLVLGKRVL